MSAIWCSWRFVRRKRSIEPDLCAGMSSSEALTISAVETIVVQSVLDKSKFIKHLSDESAVSLIFHRQHCLRLFRPRLTHSAALPALISPQDRRQKMNRTRIREKSWRFGTFMVEC